MIVWSISFQVYQAIPSFPFPGRVEEEIHAKPTYHCEGSQRHDNNLLFVYTLKGRGRFRKHQREYDLLPGTAFLCRSSDDTIAWYYPDETTIPWQFLWISFFGKTAEAMLDDLTHRHGHVYQLPVTSPLIRRLCSFRQFQQRLYPLTTAEGADLVFLVLNSLSSVVESYPLDDPRKVLVKQAQEYVLEKLPGAVTVSGIAAHLSMSREHFSRLFRQQTGMAAVDYILQQKLFYACRLLKESQLSCKEIAHSLGYRNPTNFSRAFKTMLNMSPKQFRSEGTMPLF